jgi:hypothetical protein
MSRKFNLEDFEKKFVKTDGCWEWLATKNSDGYGRVKRLGKLESAHRVSYELYKGPFDLSKHVCHKCDNPACVNPDHLWLGDYKSNNLDKKEKGRAVGCSMPGEKHPASKLTEDKVKAIIFSQEHSAFLAGLYNVSVSLINLIKARKRWKHVSI